MYAKTNYTINIGIRGILVIQRGIIMKQSVKKVIWYLVMCISSLGGVYMLYQAVTRMVLADGDRNALAGYGLILLLKYPVLLMLILVLLFVGGVGFLCIGKGGNMKLGLSRQQRLERILYFVAQCLFLIFLLDGIRNKDMFSLISMTLLSISAYMGAVWIGNIHDFVIETRE